MNYSKALIFTSAFICSVSFATRSRMESLQSNHLTYGEVDTENIINYPTKILERSNFFLLETGDTDGLIESQRAFGALAYSINSNSALLVQVGRGSDLADDGRERFNAYNNLTEPNQFMLTQNRIRTDYVFRSGGFSYALGIHYSDYKDKAIPAESQSGDLNLGLRFGDFTISAIAELANRVDLVPEDYVRFSKGGKIDLAYELDDMQFLFHVRSNDVVRMTNDVEMNSQNFIDYSMGFVKNFVEQDEFLFYRFDLMTNQVNDRKANVIRKVISLPVVIGMESIFTDYLKVRASIKQTVGVYKSEDEFDAGANNTTAAVGLGAKVLETFTVDGTLSGLVGSSPSQDLNHNKFITSVSLTYNWH